MADFQRNGFDFKAHGGAEKSHGRHGDRTPVACTSTRKTT